MHRDTRDEALHARHNAYFGVTQLDLPHRKALADALRLKGSPFEISVCAGHALPDDGLDHDTRFGGSSPLRSGLDFDSRIITEGLTRRATSEREAAALRGAVTGWREIPEFKEHLLPVPETDRA